MSYQSHTVYAKRYKYGVLFLQLLLFGGCDNSSGVNDLTAYVNSVRSMKKAEIQPIPEIKTFEPYVFTPLRDPFIASDNNAAENTAKPEEPKSTIQPPVRTHKEVLESYSLENIKMVGTLNINNTLWALVKTNDDAIHRVKKGNYMGRNYGEIIRITANKIELKEIVPDGQGGWAENLTHIELVES